MKKYHMVYRTTNLANNKIYIGIHSTNNLNDGYLGSGSSLLLAVKKYGTQNFKRDILFLCPNRQLIIDIEKIIVDSNFISTDKNYNERVGGGITYRKKRTSPAWNKGMKFPGKRTSTTFKKGQKSWNKGLKMGAPSEETKKKRSKTLTEGYASGRITKKRNYRTGPHKEESIKKMTVTKRALARYNYENNIHPQNSKPVLQFSIDGDFISEYYSMSEANRQTKIDTSSILCCCKGRSKSAGGYTWRYKYNKRSYINETPA